MIIFAWLAAACGSLSVNQPVTNSQSPAGTYQSLTVDALADILSNQPQDYMIVNVHIPYAGEIDGTQVNIPYNDISALMTALLDKKPALFCTAAVDG